MTAMEASELAAAGAPPSPTPITIHERDISSRVCRLCAACCRIKVLIPNTDSRYRTFLRKIGYSVLPAAPAASADCCDKVHDATLDLGWCKHLRLPTADSSSTYACSIYGSPEFPQLCAQYNCVSWAKSSNKYNPQNELLRKAQQALLSAQALETPTFVADDLSANGGMLETSIQDESERTDHGA